MFLSLQPIGHDHGPHRAQVSPFLAEFLSDLTWLSPSSHRVTAKSYTDLRRTELERGKKCADVQMLVPSHAGKTRLISQAVRTCENTEVDFT